MKATHTVGYHGNMYYSAGNAWYTREEVKAGAVEMEPPHYRKGYHAPRNREELVACARSALHSAQTNPVPVRADQCQKTAQAKEVRTYAAHYAHLLGVSTEELWELVGLAQAV